MMEAQHAKLSAARKDSTLDVTPENSATFEGGKGQGVLHSEDFRKNGTSTAIGLNVQISNASQIEWEHRFVDEMLGNDVNP